MSSLAFLLQIPYSEHECTVSRPSLQAKNGQALRKNRGPPLETRSGRPPTGKAGRSTPDPAILSPPSPQRAQSLVRQGIRSRPG
jgi:hypothetical protein